MRQSRFLVVNIETGSAIVSKHPHCAVAETTSPVAFREGSTHQKSGSASSSSLPWRASREEQARAHTAYLKKKIRFEERTCFSRLLPLKFVAWPVVSTPRRLVAPQLIHCVAVVMSSNEEEAQEVQHDAHTYQSRAHRLATLFIMTAGSANASQFPMMFIVYGGVPFLLAYLAFLGAVAFPVMRLESNLAQFAGDGNRGIFSPVPLFIGLGITLSLYAIVHMVGDSVAVSDQLLFLLDSLREATWDDCLNGLLLPPNRTCYVPRHAFSLCRNTRARLVEAFRRQPLSHGVPTVQEGQDFSVVLVPAKVYRQEMAGCLPGVYSYLQPYQPRRHAGWFEESWSAQSEIRAEPFLSLAAIWMVVFALAHHGFTTVKRTVYVMVGLHVCTTFLLLVRGATLPGAMSGLGMLLSFDWSYVVNLEMWYHALYVSLESFGITGSIYLGIVRFNNFKNDYHRDVNFVLVADTATKGLRMAITFMFLGHLASSVGIDTRMLVGIESHLIVGVMPEAMSVVPYQELWSQVHSLWLLSTMLPKFLIMPDIVIEVLAPAQPLVLINRTLIHFFICVSLLLISVVVCSPGGANIAAIIVHNHDQNLRFVMLFLESMVFLQFCGVRRLDIASRMMTGRECSVFVKVCLASVIPVITITMLSAKLLSKFYGDGHYPIWIYAVMTWFDLVQLSCIPVFAIVFMNETELDIDNCLLPLPTWLPVNWEHAMYYRKTLVVEGFDTDARKHPRAPPRAKAKPTARPSSKKPADSSSDSSSSSSTEFLGSAFVVASDRLFVQPGSDTLRRSRKPMPAASSGVASLSGTVHVSRHLSSVRRSVIRGRHVAEAADQADMQEGTSKASVAAVREGLEPSEMVVQSHPALEEVPAQPEAVSPAQQQQKVESPQGSPERSVVPTEVQQVGEVQGEHQYAEVCLLEPQTVPAPADVQPAIADGDANACARKTATEVSLAPLTSCEANRQSHENHDGRLAFPQKTKNDGEMSEPPASWGAGMPGAVESAQLDHKAVTGARLPEAVDGKEKVAQAHLPSSAISRKPRLSVEEILMQNKPFPFSPSEGGLVSDMHVRVLGAPGAATVMPEQAEAARGKQVAGATAAEKPEWKPSLEQPQKQAEAEQRELSGLRSGARQSKAIIASSAKRITPRHRHPKRHKPKHLADKVTPAGERPLAEGAHPREEANLQIENAPHQEHGRREKSRERGEKPEEAAFEGAALQPSLFPHRRDPDGARLSQAAEGENIVDQEHGQAIVVSKKPRLSVQEMLLQNKALPISPTDGGILSDMCIRVSGAPQPPGPTAPGHQGISHSKQPLEVGESKDVADKGKQVSAGRQQQRGLRDAGGSEDQGVGSSRQ
ncbi:hypothetical protein MTO96_023863 [Rhipicephalus appendiculatus]